MNYIKTHTNAMLPESYWKIFLSTRLNIYYIAISGMTPL